MNARNTKIVKNFPKSPNFSKVTTKKQIKTSKHGPKDLKMLIHSQKTPEVPQNAKGTKKADITLSSKHPNVARKL